MPEIRSCDPAAYGVLFNVVQYAVDNGNVEVTITWDWDGTSTFPDCDGPVQSIRVRNSSDQTYYCNLPAKRRGLHNFELLPHTDTTYSGNQLRQAGVDNYASTIGVTPSPVPFD